MHWRLTISWWEGRVQAEAIVKTKAQPKVEAKVKDNDMATGPYMAGR